jgi:DNA-binding transcriptional ArsR family regulator
MSQERDCCERLARVFKALGHATRLGILKRTAEGQWCVGDLQEQLQCSQPNISQHLAVLRNRGLVVPCREGNRVCYRLTDERIADVLQTAQSIFAPESAGSAPSQPATSKGGK